MLIRGEEGIIDEKYDITRHPNIKYTTDGGAKPYEHGTTEKAIGSIEIVNELENIDIKEISEIADTSYELLSEEEIEKYYFMEEYENEKNEENKKTTNN